MTRLMRRLRHRCREERGVVLIIMAASLTAFIGFAALALDTGSWRQSQQQAQSTADSAALAGSDVLAADIANGSCSAGASCPDAVAAATDYVTKNGMSTANACAGNTVGICVTVPADSTHPYAVKVVETTRGASFLGGILGGNTTPFVSATSVSQGTVTTGQTVTTTTGTSTGVTTGTSATTTTSTGTSTTVTPGITSPFFAASTDCSAISFDGLNGGSIAGLVTNGGVDFGGSNSSSIGSLSYGSGCSAPTHNSGVHYPTPTVNSGNLPFPVDYRAASQTTPCTNTHAEDQNGNATIPSGSVVESGDSYSYSVNFLTFKNSVSVSGIYCANTIDLTNSATLNGSATFIANSFGGGGISDSGTVTPYYNNLLLGLTGSGTQQINSSTFLNAGVIFAPYSEIYLNSNALTGGTQSFLIEADTIHLTNMNSGTLQAPSNLSSPTTSTTTTSTVIPKTVTTTATTTTTTTATVTGTTTSAGASALTQ